MSEGKTIDYQYSDAEAPHTQAYLWQPTIKLLGNPAGARVFDLGCGNGAFVSALKQLGCDVIGVDPSEEGILRAKEADPSLAVEVGNAYDPLAGRYGTFPSLVSLEVVEHVYYPRKFAKCVADLLAPGGVAIISTPYHSYLKNVALALSGHMDSHFTALWDHGHIKFWSVDTLTRLFEEQGLIREDVKRVGRFPLLAKSMILTFRKP
jgi:2-polyprenyl-3-methyl-5-hydroxy-6-metoxy-1,4-benzoquinol methylase